MENKCRFWILAIALLGLAHWVSCQSSPANVPHEVVTAKANAPANLTCDSRKEPLASCLWKKVGGGSQVVINLLPTLKNGQATTVSGYTYIGDGLNVGQCGIQINSVKEQDTDWECLLFGTSGSVLIGTVKLNILRKPKPPIFDKDLGKLVEGAEMQISCGSKAGQPPPKFQWFIGDDEIKQGLQTVESSTTGGEVMTFQRLFHKFSWRDSGKKLRCKTVSDALSEGDVNEVAQDIVVEYAPTSADSGALVQADIGVKKIISFNISSNPAPTVRWTIDAITVEGGQNSSNKRFEAKVPRQLNSDLYQCDLVVFSVEAEDFDKNYKLTARNLYGSKDFVIKISSTGEVDDSIGGGTIVALVLGIPLLIIVIALVVVFARAKGMLCFKGDDGTSSEKERMGEDGDSNKVGNEEKPTISSRLSALYENLLAKKKDKTAPMDEETANKEKDKDNNAGSDEKKPDDIVYAELDLAREGAEGRVQPVVVRGSDDKTEYAEIVGVAPPPAKDEKKSPTGSKNSSPKN